MPEEDKKTRNRTPRSDTHQAVLDAIHVVCKSPFADKRDAALKAMLEHKRKMFGDDSITTL